MTTTPTPSSKWPFTKRAMELKSSIIRDILKLTQSPHIISFAGGLPSPLTFPIGKIREAFDKILGEKGQSALQYGPSDGYAPLREWIAQHLSTKGATITPNQVLMTSGSQQGLDLIGKVLVEEGSKVLTQKPSYLGALQAFSVYLPQFVSLESDSEGVMPDSLASHPDARLFYCLPNFQNPSGLTISKERRVELVNTASTLNIPLVEDDPYGALCYDGEPFPTMLSSDPSSVIYLGTFSKILTPGIRLGYVVAPPSLIQKLEQAKQAADLHTAQISQMVVYEVIKDGFLEKHIPNIRHLYAQQSQAMLQALAKYFPPTVTWTKPMGGMFIWVTLPPEIDSMTLYKAAIQENVAFVPGAPFYANTPETNTLRLSFVTVPPEKIDAGIHILGKLITNMIKDKKTSPGD